MSRENLIPILGLLGLVLAGGLMLWATSSTDDAPSGPQPTVDERTGEVKGAKQGSVPPLVYRRDPTGRPIPAQPAPNVIVVVPCSVRRGALGPYGGPDGLSPEIDAMAARGTLFEDAIAPGVYSKESVGAMITGRHAVDLGLVDPGPQPSRKSLSQDVVTLPERFADAGWWTVGVNTSPELRRRTSALWQGIDFGRDAHPNGFKMQHRLTDPRAVTEAIRMMNERPLERPFFMELVLSDSHKPMHVPPAESARWTEAGLPTPAYLATVHRLDRAMGILFDWLEDTGLDQETYVVLVGDHGEGLSQPEHHGPAHGRYLAQSAAQIPWIVSGPGIPAGGRIEGLASGIDLGPTLLALAGIEGGMDSPEAMDHSALLRAGQGRTARVRAITDTWYMNANRAAIWTSERQCQKDFGSEGLDGDGFVDGCFDRAMDPEFFTPIEDAELMAELVAWRAAHAPG